MPYITKQRREDIRASGSAINAGELNFQITTLLIDYVCENGGRYQQINDALGVLEGAKLEFYRRLAAPYEDTKILENGDVY